VRPDPFNASFGSSGDLGRRSRAPQEPEQMRRRPPAQKRAFAGGKHSGVVAGEDAGRPVPDPIDPSVLANESAVSHTRLDLLVRNASTEELRARHHPVAGARDPRQFFLDCPAWGPYMGP
jgi:hypothetical protein